MHRFLHEPLPRARFLLPKIEAAEILKAASKNSPSHLGSPKEPTSESIVILFYLPLLFIGKFVVSGTFKYMIFYYSSTALYPETLDGSKIFF